MTFGTTKTKKKMMRIRKLRSRNMRRIHLLSMHTRGRHMRSRGMRSRRLRSRGRNINMFARGISNGGGSRTRSRKMVNTRSSLKRISIGGNEPLSFLPTPHKILGIENGASTPQESAMISQRNADLEQNEKNNMIGGDGEEDNLPVVQFSGKNSAVTNQQSLLLTNILAENRAAGVGDADVTIRK